MQWLCVIACSAGLLTADTNNVQPVRPLVLQLLWCPQAQFAGYMMAKEKGFLNEAGLKGLTLRWACAGDRPLDRLANGEVDFCTAWLSNAVVRRTQGTPIVLVAQVFQRSSMLLVTRSDSGIERPEDMAGRRVGLWGGDFDVRPVAFFRQFHVEPEIVPQSTSIVPFLRGAVDVMSAMYYNEYHKLIEAGLEPQQLKVFVLSDYGLDFPEDGIYCLEATRRDRPDACAALVKAVGRGWAYALEPEHEEETLDVVMDYCRNANIRTGRNHQRWMLRAMRQCIPHTKDGGLASWGQLRRETYDEATSLLSEQGLIQSPPDFEQFYQPPGSTNAPQIPDPH
jgi:NitT/TauT family transport system substrate-binding protein